MQQRLVAVDHINAHEPIVLVGHVLALSRPRPQRNPEKGPRGSSRPATVAAADALRVASLGAASRLRDHVVPVLGRDTVGDLWVHHCRSPLFTDTRRVPVISGDGPASRKSSPVRKSFAAELSAVGRWAVPARHGLAGPGHRRCPGLAGEGFSPGQAGFRWVGCGAAPSGYGVITRCGLVWAPHACNSEDCPRPAGCRAWSRCAGKPFAVVGSASC
jgi:hypothetical protein